jgi:hypothetical protein
MSTSFRAIGKISKKYKTIVLEKIAINTYLYNDVAYFSRLNLFSLDCELKKYIYFAQKLI